MKTWKKMTPEIIIIDDDEVVLYLHELYLHETFPAGNVISFTCAEKAMEYLSSEAVQTASTQFIVLLDINMPKMNGWELMDRLSGQPISRRLNIYLVTSSIDPKDKIKAQKYPLVVGFCEKPVDEEFCRTLTFKPIEF